MKIPIVDLQAQYRTIREEVLAAIHEVLDKSAFIKGVYVEEFEYNFARALGIDHCVGVGNGTDALMIALKSMGIGAGDEVIVPANSFIATSEAVTAARARVVFADNDPDTYTMDPDKVREKISTKTKAIIAVHFYGQMADMLPLLTLADTYGLKIIEDAAQAHMAEYRMPDGTWRKAGTFGEMATFSFFPGKNLGAYGDGGAIVTNDDELARLARMYGNHGRIAKYDHEFEGYNSRLDGLQAAILNVKLKYLTEWIEKRRAVAETYSLLLSDIPDIILPKVHESQRPVWHLYVIRNNKRDQLKSYLKKNGIETGVHYPIALPNLNAYRYLGHTINDFPVASSFQKQILSLPIFPEITREQIEYVSKYIKLFYDL